jgi:hypothetical protein
MSNRWGSYDDYAQEVNEDAEREAHENFQCNEVTCIYCIEARDEQARTD